MDTSEAVQEKMKDYRFLEYAARFWYIHAQQSEEWSGRLIDLTHKIFDPNGRQWTLWSTILDQAGLDLERYLMSVLGDLDSVSPLHYASRLGFMHPLHHLQKQVLDPDLSIQQGFTKIPVDVHQDMILDDEVAYHARTTIKDDISNFQK
jgi:hypothetical protein